MENKKFYDLKELGRLLLMHDNRSVIKWLKEKNIPIQIIGKKKVVHRFTVDIELDRSFIQELKLHNPDKWEELYNCYKNDNKLEYLLLLNSNDHNLDNGSIRINPKSERSLNFLKRFGK